MCLNWTDISAPPMTSYRTKRKRCEVCRSGNVDQTMYLSAPIQKLVFINCEPSKNMIRKRVRKCCRAYIEHTDSGPPCLDQALRCTPI